MKLITKAILANTKNSESFRWLLDMCDKEELVPFDLAATTANKRELPIYSSNLYKWPTKNLCHVVLISLGVFYCFYFFNGEKV
jgi:hypothetical protein